MTTPHVTEVTSARRAPYVADWQRAGWVSEAALYGADYRARCAELRELDRQADAARATGGAA